MSKYQALIDALESAQSSNWSHDGEADVYETDVGILVASAMETEDAAYIAAANPATIRALLADLERAEKALREGGQPAPLAGEVTDDLVRETIKAIQDPDTVNAFHNGYYTLTPEELRRAILTLRPQAVPMTDSVFDLICNAIDKADTITMQGDYMMDSDDCIAVVRVMQALMSVRGITAKAEGAKP